jgi:diacylglycerol kinase family enzyme
MLVDARCLAWFIRGFMHNVLVILNARAGVLLDRDPAEVRREIEIALRARGRHIEVVLEHGQGMVRAIERGAGGDYDTLIVGGGDGSVSCAVHLLAGKPVALGVLPLGTLNLLARDLGMPVELSEALGMLAAARPRAIDLASLNGRRFHSLSGLGFFSQMARAREEARDLPGKMLRLGAAAFRAFSRTGHLTLEFDIDGKDHRMNAYAALVTCNRFGGQDWRRDNLDGGMLEIHIAEEEGALARLKAGADMLAGGWRDNGGIHSYAARRVRIGSARRRVWVATDGELRREKMPLDFTVEPRVLTILSPS